MGIRSNKVLDQINVKESFEKKKGPSSGVWRPEDREKRYSLSFISVTARTASLNLNFHWHGHGNLFIYLSFYTGKIEVQQKVLITEVYARHPLTRTNAHNYRIYSCFF